MPEWWNGLKTAAGFGGWVNAIINAIIHKGTIVSAVGALGAAVWAWFSDRDGLDIFVITAIIFVVILTAINQFSAFLERRRQAELKESEVITDSSDILGEGAPDQAPDRYYSDRDVYIYDLVTDEQRVINKTFERCTIFGPAVLWLFKCQLVNLNIDIGLDKLYVSAFSSASPGGAVIVKRCTFIDCNFRRISLCVEKPLRETIQAMLSPPEPDKDKNGTRKISQP